MPCVEIMELESVWQKRFERANSAEAGGLFAVSLSARDNTLTLRQLRAKQAQAAHAILTHQKECSMCNSGEVVEPFTWSDSLAS